MKITSSYWEKVNKEGDRTMSEIICICDYCVYSSSCDASSMCEECEEFEYEEREQ